MPFLLGHPQLFLEELQPLSAIVITKIDKNPTFKIRCIIKDYKCKLILNIIIALFQ